MLGGVFCIENWAGDLRASGTVLPLLNFLRDSGAARIIHQRVSTPRELHHYLARFATYDTYRVGYLAMHGSRGSVWIGAHEVSLEDLTTWARLDEHDVPTDAQLDDPNDWAVDLAGKVIYLGSCATLGVSDMRMQDFLDATGAAAVCGYTRSVDWFASGAFDVMLLSALAHAMDGAPHTPANAIKSLRRDAASLCETLGFRCRPDWRP